MCATPRVLLRRNPLFALTAVVSLAIGIGANTTIFTIANALLFRQPVGVVEPERLVDIGRSQNRQGFDTNSYPNYLDIRTRNTVLSGVYAYRLEPQPMSLGGPDGAERVYGDIVTTNYFDVLGARPRVLDAPFQRLSRRIAGLARLRAHAAGVLGAHDDRGADRRPPHRGRAAEAAGDCSSASPRSIR